MVSTNRKILIMSVAAILFAVNFGALAQGSSTTTPSGEFIFGTPIQTTITDLNPLTVSNSVASDIVTEIYANTLLYMWPNGNLTSWLANSWQITEHSNNSETITFHLNPNADWVNGTAVAGQITSKDVKFTFDVMKANSSLDSFGVTKYLYNISTPNNTTVIFNFSKQSNLWLIYLSQQIIIPSAWSQYDSGNLSKIGGYTNMHTPIGQVISAGPFILNSSNSAGVTMVANTHFWMGTPKIAKIIWEEFKSTSTSTEALKTGAIAAEFPSLSDYNSLSTTPNITNVAMPEPWIFNLWMNDGHAPFNNVHFRKGIAYAINKTQIMQKAEDGLGTYGSQNVSFGGLPTLLKSYWANNLTYYGYNVSKAKAEFEKAGYHLNTSVSKQFLVNNTTNKMLTVTIEEPPISDWESAATFIQSNLIAAGINTNVVVAPFSTWGSYTFNQTNFVGMSYFGFVPSFTNPYYDLQDLYGYGSFWSGIYNFTNKSVPSDLNASVTITNNSQLMQSLYPIQKIIDEEVPIIPIGNAYNYYAYNDQMVAGVMANMSITNPLNLMNIYQPTQKSPSSSPNIVYIGGGVVIAAVIIGSIGYMLKKKGKQGDQ